jgi:hypothetical protein
MASRKKIVLHDAFNDVSEQLTVCKEENALLKEDLVKVSAELEKQTQKHVALEEALQALKYYIT